MAENYYVLDKFAEIDRNLVGIMEAMPIKRRAIDIYRQKNNIARAKETYTELEELKAKLLDAIMSLELLFSECDMQDNVNFCVRLYGALKSFNLLTTDYSKMISNVERLKGSIPQNETTNAAIVGRLMNNIRMGYYPTDIAHVKMIKSALKYPERRINLLDPCCGCGTALNILELGQEADTYGIEIDEERGKEAEDKLYRVGFGSFFHSRISHEAFHALFLNPPYLSVIGEGGTRARSEKRFLVESLHHLMNDGILMYVIPYYRLTYDICRVLCDNFRNISIFKFQNDEFIKFKQIVVFGIKKAKDDGSNEAEILSQYAMLPDKIPIIDTLTPESYEIPNVEKKVEQFKGAVFNLGELQRQIAKSKSVNMFFEKSRIDAVEKRPLLPLNVGQVGLIGGSGLINGYVDCESPHVIKGRIIKELKCREDTDAGTVTETRVNRMLFNILTPNGLKKLA